MDRNSIIGLVLIAGILIVFSLTNREEPKKKEKKKTEQTQPEISVEDSAAVDTVNVDIVADTIPQTNEDVAEEPIDSALLLSIKDSSMTDSIIVVKYDSIVEARKTEAHLQDKKEEYGLFYKAAEGKDSCYTIQSKDIRVVVCNKGAQIKKVELLKYRSYNTYNEEEDNPLVLVDSTNEFSFDITEGDLSHIYNTEDLYFNDVELNDNKISLTAHGEKNRSITFDYEITDTYEVKMRIRSDKLESNTNFDQLVWEMKARDLEKSRWQQNQVAGLFYKYDNSSRDYLSEGSDDEEEIEASMDWVAFKHSFFSAIFIADGEISKGGEMRHWVLDQGDYIKRYKVEFDNPGLDPNTESEFTWYFGPNDYDILASYDMGMHRLINHGWGIFGWINRNFFLPLYQWLTNMGLNQGLIIILMTLIIRAITTPLVFRNYRSSAKMKLLKPEIEELGKKFPDQKDAMKKQQATMALYRSTGVNPLAGCVPMLIQMPILFAMFRLVPTLLELRQESFLWADDLASYDAIVTWQAQIPLLSDFYGNHISLFTLLMAGSTLAYTLINMNQMSPSQPGMPNMKFIMYLFPIMMIFFFNRYSSGLSFYYFLSSLFSMGIMIAIKHYFIDEDKLLAQIQANKKKPKKKSKFQQRLEEMQKQQANKRKK